MFLNGKIYSIRRAEPALRTAAARFLARMAGGESSDHDPLGQYDAMVEARSCSAFRKWLCKHLVPDLPEEEITESNKDEISRAIELRHRDPDREAALTIKRQRAWEAENGNRGTTD